jgi:asparagine synthase (glutamine-hydrolysing)
VPKPYGKAPKKWAATLLRELEEAVWLWLRADVPVGLYLSGGIDSTFVGALMKKNASSALHSFSISFPDSDRNEQEFALKAAAFLGTEHHDLTVSRRMLWDHLEDCLWHSELPFLTLAPVGKYLLSREARKRVTVVLTGEGADEVFLGYRKFFHDAIRDTRDGKTGFGSLWARMAGLTPGGLQARVLQHLSLYIFRRQHRPAIAAARARPIAPPLTKPVINAIQEGRLADMPMRILCYLGDRTEMAHSLEARLPFLDHKLFDMARSMPADFKMRNSQEKAVLRDAARGLLPEELRRRRKVGFMHTSAFDDFFGADKPLTGEIRRYLSRQNFARAGVFSYGAYRILRLLAVVPVWSRFPALRQLRRHANQAIMFIVQTHMLQKLYIDEPAWDRPPA